LTRDLWCRKVWIGRSRGLSTVLGIVFLILVVFAIATNVFLWTLSQNAQYAQAVKDENQKNVDRLSENLVASGTNYTVSDDEVNVKVTVRNAGSVAARIINLWVFDTDPSNQRYTNKSLDLNLNPGDAVNFRGVSSLKVTIPGANASHEFVAWFVTARGNTVPLESVEDIIVAQLAQGIGSIGMTFPDFKYYNVSQVGPSWVLNPFPSGGSGYTVPFGKYIAFRVTLTNYDESKQDLKLYSHSALWMLFPAIPTQPRSAWWYIVNVNESGTIVTPFTTITLEWGMPTQVYFAAEANGGSSPFNKWQAQCQNQPAAVNLMLVGKIGDSAYGQNIPFVSVFVRS